MRHRKVTLDAVGCCAMTHAFLRHPEHVRVWSQASGQLHVLYEIFGGTSRLSFIPNEETTSAYRAFAAAELARLASCGRNVRLLCAHGGPAHARALGELMQQLPKVSAH